MILAFQFEDKRVCPDVLKKALARDGIAGDFRIAENVIRGTSNLPGDESLDPNPRVPGQARSAN